jgi:hypothetical protein
MNETDRPHRALEEFDALWLESHAAKLPGPSLETTMLRNIAASVRAALAPEQREDAEPQEGTREALNLETLRERGWSVAVHNDYRLNGERFTFWLLTRGDRCVKGEGRTDAEAFEQIAAALAAPTQEGERHLRNVRDWIATNAPPAEAHWMLAALDTRAAPTPDREALREREQKRAALAWMRAQAKVYAPWLEADAGALSCSRILADALAAPPSEPDWLREYELRKLALLEASAATCDHDGYSEVEADAYTAAERALDDWVLAALPGGREREPEWRPIATAPKDERPKLIAGGTVEDTGRGAGPEAFKGVTVAWWDEDAGGGWFSAYNEGFDTGLRHEPTHWMPLPAAPQASADTGAGR